MKLKLKNLENIVSIISFPRGVDHTQINMKCSAIIAFSNQRFIYPPPRMPDGVNMFTANVFKGPIHQLSQNFRCISYKEGVQIYRTFNVITLFTNFRRFLFKFTQTLCCKVCTFNRKCTKNEFVGLVLPGPLESLQCSPDAIIQLDCRVSLSGNGIRQGRGRKGKGMRAWCTRVPQM